MRVAPRHWHNETWVCSLRGHVIPASQVTQLDEGDRQLGVDLRDGTRHSRCLRCDSWIETLAPDAEQARWKTMPGLAELPLPRRGKVLQDAIFLRVIACNKGLHALVFGLLALALATLELKLGALKAGARDLEATLTSALDSAGRNPARQAIASGAHRVLRMDPHELNVLLGLAVVYFVIESVEAVGLWKEKRWAEYLTAVATAGFLPLELHELFARVTAPRVGALVVNVAMLVWLVVNKHLFGVRGGERTLHEHASWQDILGTLAPASGRAANPGQLVNRAT